MYYIIYDLAQWANVCFNAEAYKSFATLVISRTLLLTAYST